MDNSKEDAQNKGEEFLKEIMAVMVKYDAWLDEGDHYDQEENYIGSSYTICVGNLRFAMEDLFQ